MRKQLVGYCRISEEDAGAEASSSILSQKALLEDYAAKHGLCLSRCFIDDGHSGITMERPALQELLALCQADKISTILVKDLSRLGRNYKALGQLAIFLQEQEIRLISVLDNLDTSDGESDLFPFLTMVHEMYSRDISKKMLTLKKQMQEKGNYYGTLPPYGYQKSSLNKHVLEIEEEAAQVVREIFTWAAQGLGTTCIAKRLTASAVPAPFAHFRALGHSTALAVDDFYWSPTLVRSILRNPVYLGTLTFGRNSSSRFFHSTRPKPAKDCTIWENAHTPIIDFSLFEQVADRLATPTLCLTDAVPSYLKGKVRCHSCGKIMYFSKDRNFFQCEGKRLRGPMFCSAAGISLLTLQNHLSKAFARLFFRSRIALRRKQITPIPQLEFLLAQQAFTEGKQRLLPASKDWGHISGTALTELETLSTAFETHQRASLQHASTTQALRIFYEKVVHYDLMDMEKFVLEMVERMEIHEDGIQVFYREVGSLA